MNILIRAHLENQSGYGQHVEHTARQLERLGHRVQFENLNEGGPLPDFAGRAVGNLGTPDQVLQICPPFRPCPPGAIYCTTWESDRLPPPCVTHLAPARLVIVNSEFIQRAFVASNVAAPVRVIPLGVSPVEYRPIHPPPVECRFGVVANLSTSPRRKNIEGAIAGFLRAFPHDRDVSLLIKLNRVDEFAQPDDPRIVVIRGTYSTEQMNWFYNSLTCFVSASMAEGFGLCPLQAMACGRPVIATTYGGHAEYLDETVGYPVDYELIQPAWYEGGGNLALPSVQSLAGRMRDVFMNRPVAGQRGETALARAGTLTWDRYGDRLLAAIETV